MSGDAAAELKKKRVSTWSKEEVGEWLQDVGYGEFKEKFSENAIDGETLVKLTQDELKELDVQALGTRKKMMELIGSLSEETAANEEAETEKKEAEAEKVIKEHLKEKGSEVNMDGYKGEDMGLIIRVLLQKFDGANMKSIILHNTAVTDDDVKELAQKCTQLNAIGLSHCNNITDAAVIEIAQKCTTLEIFHIPPGMTDAGKKELTSRGFTERFANTCWTRPGGAKKNDGDCKNQ